MTVFRCEEQHDNHFAYISSDGRTVATANPRYDDRKVIVKFFDIATQKKLLEKELDTDVFDIKLNSSDESAYVLVDGGIVVFPLF